MQRALALQVTTTEKRIRRVTQILNSTWANADMLEPADIMYHVKLCDMMLRGKSEEEAIAELGDW